MLPAVSGVIGGFLLGALLLAAGWLTGSWIVGRLDAAAGYKLPGDAYSPRIGQTAEQLEAAETARAIRERDDEHARQLRAFDTQLVEAVPGLARTLRYDEGGGTRWEVIPIGYGVRR